MSTVNQKTTVEDQHKEYVDGLIEEYRILIRLKREVYEGSWDGMLSDLRARLDKKPHIPKLFARIETDIGRIEEMIAYEGEHSVDMVDYIGEE